MGAGVTLTANTTGEHSIRNILVEGGTLSFGSAVSILNLGGNITNNGSLSFSVNQSITFAGASTIAGANAVSFPNGLTLAGGAAASLATDITIGDSLTFAGGNLFTGNARIRLDGPTVGEAPGSCIVTNGSGIVSREVIPGASASFPISPADGYFNPLIITLASGDPAEIFSVAARNADFPSIPVPQGMVQCSWTIVEDAPGGNTATLALGWDARQEGERFRTGVAILLRHDGSQWTSAGSGSIAGNDPFVFTSGTPVSDFSVFAVATEEALPVQTVLFRGSGMGARGVLLEWSTESETNNYGFEVERSCAGVPAFRIVSCSIPGAGTSIVPHQYSFSDRGALEGDWSYRLRQWDLDGTSHVSDAIVVRNRVAHEGVIPGGVALFQNWPNPLNPVTYIEFALPVEAGVTLEVFDPLGRRLATLVKGARRAGFHRERFDATRYASGTLFYRLTAGEFRETKRMVVVK
jgi:hypothetical protein